MFAGTSAQLSSWTLTNPHHYYHLEPYPSPNSVLEDIGSQVWSFKLSVMSQMECSCAVMRIIEDEILSAVIGFKKVVGVKGRGFTLY